MAKAELTFLFAIAFSTGVLLTSFSQYLYEYLMALMLGAFLFFLVSTVPRAAIFAILAGCIVGSMYSLMFSPRPERNSASQNNSNVLENILFSIRTQFVDHVRRVLPSEEGALATGLTVGDQAGFDATLQTAMRKSGTTHLVALSGYNIAILVGIIEQSLRGRVRRRTAFWITILLITLFVIMVGAQASIVRAALMGALMLLAQYNGRVPTFRIVIAVTAMLMLLENPALIRVNIGFQLSFLSILGIAYIAPALLRYINQKNEKQLSIWKENLIAGIAAQAAVLPLLVQTFEHASLGGIFATVLIIGTVPVTMALVFIVGAVGWISTFLATIGSWFAYPLLWYQIHVIYFFAAVPIPVSNPFGSWIVILYYAGLCWFVWRYYPRAEFPYRFRHNHETH